MKYKLGIDVGGTFTDFILISDSGETSVHKTLSTPEDPSVGVLSGIYDLSDILNLNLDDFIQNIETVVHGTTVATNALLTLKGAKTALITTKGVRDALEMRRGIREEQYNNHYRNVVPLIPRYLRMTVDERINAQGEVLTALDESELLPIIEFLKEEEVESVAICYLNAFLNSTHEQKTAQFLKQHLPSCFITASTEVLPSIRFYERVSTTAVNAYLGPIVANYLGKLTEKLDDIKFSGTLLIMQSNGGVVTPDIVKKSPAVTVLSGPAAAPTAGAFYANLLGYKDCITIDMGGTSFDASLVIDNQCVTSSDGEINRYKIALPSLDIATIGAGGGSIGWIDSGGLLQMGPQSAGAMPGPICYDRGGILPTCTDANLLLGYLNPDFFAGGEIKLDTEHTKQIITEQVAPKLGLSLQETVVGMYRIINSNMAQGVRQVSIEKGYDPREFLIIVAGGAGAIHAGEICKELEVPMFIVPDVASIFCAAGMLLGDLKHDYIRSYITSLSDIDKDHFLNLYHEMKKNGADTLKKEGIKEDNIDFYPVMDLRYFGQYHEVQLPVPWEDIAAFDFENIKKAFHKEHNRLFGYSLEEEGTEIEVINVRLRALGITEKPKFLSESNKSISIESALKEKRQVYIPESNEVKEVNVYDGDKSLNGNTIVGPAVIEKTNTSIFVSESYNCLIDDYGSFIIYDKSQPDVIADIL
ncbi:MAG: hydantoinase/oxoprolinase family protein [Candidatus Electryonea clarkiae]|nr:hydantoinase/oxoprolinase family protein [Candidatus Electryonea clarkiae]MDP8287454.1 hydantoinase/oxoprolinase family protein [Candidatus Electryonea clarkiae]